MRELESRCEAFASERDDLTEQLHDAHRSAARMTGADGDDDAAYAHPEYGFSRQQQQQQQHHQHQMSTSPVFSEDMGPASPLPSNAPALRHTIGHSPAVANSKGNTASAANSVGPNANTNAANAAQVKELQLTNVRLRGIIAEMRKEVIMLLLLLLLLLQSLMTYYAAVCGMGVPLFATLPQV